MARRGDASEGPSVSYGPPATVPRPDLFPRTAHPSEVLAEARRLPAGTLWTDPDFPPADSSLWPAGAPRPPGMAAVAHWLRPEEFAPLPAGEAHSLVYGDAAAGDVIQGGLGDCYLLGALSTVAATPRADGASRLKDLVLPLDGGSFDNPPEGAQHGFFTFRVAVFGDWVPVTVDTLIPCGADRRPAFARAADPHELWVMYLEKAYAKLHGGYHSIEGGSLTRALVDLTAGFAEEVRLDSADARAEAADGRLWARLARYQTQGYLMGCAVTQPGGETEERTPENLIKNHAYGVVLFYEQAELPEGSRAGPLRLVQLRNPWGAGEWQGAWADGGPEWSTPEGRHAQGRLSYAFDNDGTFFMTFEDFAAHVNAVYVCKVLDPARWRRAVIRDRWSPEEGTAGGCFNYPTWRDNPQWALRLEQVSHAHFVLLQPDLRAGPGAAAGAEDADAAPREVATRTAGLYIMRGHETFLRRVLVNSEEVAGDVVDATIFANRREVAANTLDEEGELPLAAGVPFVLVPSTLRPGEAGDFKVAVYTRAPLRSVDRVPPLRSAMVEGRWAGPTAGGPPGQRAWRDNPQFVLRCAAIVVSRCRLGEVD